MPVTIKTNERGLRKARAELAHIRGGFDKVFVRASRRVASQGKTGISREIREHVSVKAGDVNKALSIGRHRKGTSVTLAEEQRLPLKYFGARQTKKGVSYKVGKGKGRSKVFNAFGPNIPRLGGHVFVRAGKSRLPIVKLFGVSPWGVFNGQKMFVPTQKKLSKKFGERLDHEVKFLIAKAKQKNG